MNTNKMFNVLCSLFVLGLGVLFFYAFKKQLWQMALYSYIIISTYLGVIYYKAQRDTTHILKIMYDKLLKIEGDIEDMNYVKNIDELRIKESD